MPPAVGPADLFVSHPAHVAIGAMSDFQQQVHSFWTQGGMHAVAVVPFGWIAIAIAMRTGFSRRALSLKAPLISAFAALIAGLVSEQLMHHSARQLGVIPSADLLAAIRQAALAPRLLGVAIAAFALVLTGFGILRRHLTPDVESATQSVRWRMAASTGLLCVAAYIAGPTVATIVVAILGPLTEGAMIGASTRSVLLVIACALGVVATAIRERGAARSVPSLPLPGA